LNSEEAVILFKIVQFFRDESGAAAIEYALILGLTTLSIVGAIKGLETSVGNMYDTVSSTVMDSINSATGG
jgi:Flp pilus assembly pilin Flp